MNINACLIFVFRKNITLYAYIKHIIASLLIVDSLFNSMRHRSCHFTSYKPYRRGIVPIPCRIEGDSNPVIWFTLMSDLASPC